VTDEALDGILRFSTITHAWHVCKNAGFDNQFIAGFQSTLPDQAMAGRALTALYMPCRPDLKEVMVKAALAAGEIGDMNSWPIDRLTERDVYVADVYGKTKDGPIVGERLSTAIYARSRNGCVHNAAVRDIDGIRDIGGFNIFHRGMDPSFANLTIMLAGINCPMRMEGITIMPGDVVLAKNDCAIFIPPHLADYCALTGAVTAYRDMFSVVRMRERKYTSGEIDSKWTEAIESDFREWLAARPDVPFTPDDLERSTRERMW
jgi:regulator of RNase E activity RraA